MDPVEVERGDGVDDEGGGDVRLTCNELRETCNFPPQKNVVKAENFLYEIYQWLLWRVTHKYMSLVA